MIVAQLRGVEFKFINCDDSPTPIDSAAAKCVLEDIAAWLGFGRDGFSYAIISYLETLTDEREKIFLRAKD